MYLFVLDRLAKKCTKTYNSCRALVRLVKPFVLRRFRCVVVCIRSLPSRAMKSHCVDVSVLCMLLYLLFKPRSLWKIWSERKYEGAFHSGAATEEACSIRPWKFPEIHTGIFGRMVSAPDIVEFLKSEPFNRKFRIFRDENQMERKFPGKYVRKFGHTTGGCLLCRKLCKFAIFYSALVLLAAIRASWTFHARMTTSRIRK